MLVWENKTNKQNNIWRSNQYVRFDQILRDWGHLSRTNINHKGLQRTANEYAEESKIYKDETSKNNNVDVLNSASRIQIYRYTASQTLFYIVVCRWKSFLLFYPMWSFGWPVNANRKVKEQYASALNHGSGKLIETLKTSYAHEGWWGEGGVWWSWQFLCPDELGHRYVTKRVQKWRRYHF